MSDRNLMELGSLIHAKVHPLLEQAVELTEYVDTHRNKIDKELLMHIDENRRLTTDLLTLLIQGGE